MRSNTRAYACALTIILSALVANVACGDAKGAGKGKKKSSKSDAKDLLWVNLRGLNVKTGKASRELREADGRMVRIPGFVVPLEDDMEYVSEFLLVPYPRACIHVPAPPENQIVHVKMLPGKSIKMQWWNPVWIRGRLRIAASNNALARASFRLAGESSEPYEDKRDPYYDDNPPVEHMFPQDRTQHPGGD